MGILGRWATGLLLVAFLTFLIPPSGSELVEGATVEEWAYHNSFEISQNLSYLSENYTFTEFTTAQDLLGTRDIPGNRTIPILFIGNRSDEDRKWIMIIGAHHGDEPDSAETVLGFAQYILPEMLQGNLPSPLIENVNFAILPVVNPYGLDTGSRYDENNEDPNRDYPFSPEGSSIHSDGIPLTTAGAHAIHNLAKMYPISIALSFHTGSKGIYTPWGAEGVDSLTPDQTMFSDLGSVLSRASGIGMLYGPANDFGGLGYLRGAFDDHLYGSTFYSQYLASSNFILPWSTATATIEMDLGRGRDEDRLGNLNGIFDIGGSDDGTIPMGVRMSLAASYMLVPSIEKIEVQVDQLGILNFTAIGCKSFNITSFTLSSEDDLLLDIDTQFSSHRFLPEYHVSGTFGILNTSNDHEIELSMEFDQSWLGHLNDSNPNIGPQSLLSHTRSGPDGVVDLLWMIEGEIGETREYPSVEIIDIQPKIQEAGRNATIKLNIPEELGDPQIMFINTQVDWNVETTIIYGINVTTGVSTYGFFTPLLEGEADVQVILTTDLGTFSSNSTMTLYPHVYIVSFVRSPVDYNKINVMVGVDGSLGSTSVFYGVSRSIDIGWGESGWLIEPAGGVSPSYGSFFFDLDLSTIGGDVYIRVCNFPGAEQTSLQIHMDLDITITEPLLREENGKLTIGPSIIFYDWDYVQEISQSYHFVTYTVKLIDQNYEYVQEQNLTWVHKHQLSDEDRSELLRIINEHDIDEDQVTGCWIGYFDIPEGMGNYSIRVLVDAQVRPDVETHSGDFYTSLRFADSYVSEGKEKKEENDDFPTGIVIFLIVVAAIIFIISILRSNAHLKDPVIPEEKPKKAPKMNVPKEELEE